MGDWGLQNVPTTNNKEKKEIAYTDDAIKKMIEQATEETHASCFNCLVIGNDGTGKSGIVLDYLSKKPKKSLIIDLDGGNTPLINEYYKDNEKLIVLNPLEVKMGEEDVEIDYKMTMAKIKALIKYVREHRVEYSGLVIDGLSTLLKHAEYQLRIEKNIAPDGGMQMRYWLNRSKVFIEILDFMKSIPVIDKFYIGHEDFMVKEDMAAVKSKTNQMIHQRIICSKKQEMGKVSFIAKIDKSKYNLGMEGKEITFATVEGDKGTWNATKIFEKLK